MATMTSVNPATGEVFGRFEELSDAELEREARPRRRDLPRLAQAPASRSAPRSCAAPPTCSSSKKEHWGRIDDARDGQDAPGRRSPRRRSAPPSCRYYAEHAPSGFLADEDAPLVAPTRSYRALPAARAGARGDAVELPLLAGLPLRRAGAHGGERRACSSTRRTCRSRALAIEEVFRRAGLPRGLLPDAARRLVARARGMHRGRAGRRRDAHRQRGRGRGGRLGRRGG